MSEHWGLGPAELADRIEDAVREFSGGALLTDDRTVVVFRRGDGAEVRSTGGPRP